MKKLEKTRKKLEIIVIILIIIKEADTMKLKKHDLKLLNQINIDRILSMNSYDIVFQIIRNTVLQKGDV